MSVLVKKEWLKTYGREERLGRAPGGIDWHAVYRYGWLLALASITVFFFIWQNVQIIRDGYEIEGLRRRLSTIQSQNSLLTVEAASLDDLGSMERRAVEELGMVRPAPGQIIHVIRQTGDKEHAEPQSADAPQGN